MNGTRSFFPQIRGEVATDIVNAFKELWNSEYTLGFDEFFGNYKEQFRIIREQREIAAGSTVVPLEKYRPEPNSMQISFIADLKKIVSAGEDKALLISATGVRVILMTGRKSLKNKEFGPAFSIGSENSYMHCMPGAGKRGTESVDRKEHSIISY